MSARRFAYLRLSWKALGSYAQGARRQQSLFYGHSRNGKYIIEFVQKQLKHTAIQVKNEEKPSFSVEMIRLQKFSKR